MWSVLLTTWNVAVSHLDSTQNSQLKLGMKPAKQQGLKLNYNYSLKKLITQYVHTVYIGEFVGLSH